MQYSREGLGLDNFHRLYCHSITQSTNMKKSNGYILYEDSVRVVIATGFVRKSDNIKTGNMIQIWILVKAENPVAAVASGSDVLVCGDCPLRGEVCYVNTGQAPLSVWKCWMRGGYPMAGSTSGEGGFISSKIALRRLFTGRKARLGAYGDPTHIPLHIVKRIAIYADTWTGYTHQWRNPLLQGYREFCMASVDTEEQASEAEGMGWRRFRMIDEGEEPQAGEIECPNYTHGVQCEDCSLCKGTSVKAKSIVIYAHGAKKKNFTKVRRNINHYTVTV